MSWAAEEFKDIDLGDRRLDKRTVLLAERMAANPLASIPQACGGWAETQAAYRFLAQDDIEWEAILAPHWRSAEGRMRAHRGGEGVRSFIITSPPYRVLVRAHQPAHRRVVHPEMLRM